MDKIENRKITSLYQDFLSYDENERSIFWRTLEVIDKKLYYQLQAKIFIENQTQIHKHIAEMLVDDCMKYFNKFKISLAEILIDDMEFSDIPADVISANKNRIKILNLKGA